MSSAIHTAVGRIARAAVLGLIAAITAAATGCQVDVGGQTLPSAYYMTDDVQYFPPGPEFKLQNEANAMRQAQLVPPVPAPAP